MHLNLAAMSMETDELGELAYDALSELQRRHPPHDAKSKITRDKIGACLQSLTEVLKDVAGTTTGPTPLPTTFPRTEDDAIPAFESSPRRNGIPIGRPQEPEEKR